jgi:hypothetical protein
LAAPNPTTTRDRGTIIDAVRKGDQKSVELAKPILVVWNYADAWASADGTVHFGRTSTAWTAERKVIKRGNKTLGMLRYFPEIVAMLRERPAARFVVDGKEQSISVRSTPCGRHATSAENMECLNNDASSRVDMATVLRCHLVRWSQNE